MENFSDNVAVLEKEENSGETERKTTALAEEYLSFNNNPAKLKGDLSTLLGMIK